MNGRSNLGNRASVSRNELIPAIRSPDNSRTINAHALCPTCGSGRYCANAGQPDAAVATRRDPRHPDPKPSIQVRTSSGPCSRANKEAYKTLHPDA